MTEFTTEGEKLVGRALEKEYRGGVEHYVTGQHKAVIVEEDYGYHAVLSFVNVLGEATMVMCRRRLDGELGPWEPGETAIRAGMLVAWGSHPLPPQFTITENMKDALDQAQAAWEEEQGLG